VVEVVDRRLLLLLVGLGEGGRGRVDRDLGLLLDGRELHRVVDDLDDVERRLAGHRVAAAAAEARARQARRLARRGDRAVDRRAALDRVLERPRADGHDAHLLEREARARAVAAAVDDAHGRHGQRARPDGRERAQVLVQRHAAVFRGRAAARHGAREDRVRRSGLLAAQRRVDRLLGRHVHVQQLLAQHGLDAVRGLLEAAAAVPVLVLVVRPDRRRRGEAALLRAHLDLERGAALPVQDLARVDARDRVRRLRAPEQALPESHVRVQRARLDALVHDVVQSRLEAVLLHVGLDDLPLIVQLLLGHGARFARTTDRCRRRAAIVAGGLPCRIP